MKTLLKLILLFVATGSMAQSKKPRTVIIKKSITVDSLVYLPDTIPVLFKELVVIKNNKEFDIARFVDTRLLSRGDSIIVERWQRGFVIFQTYTGHELYRSRGVKNLGNWIDGVTRIEYSYYTRQLQYTQLIEEKFLYSDHSPVKNRILSVLKP